MLSTYDSFVVNVYYAHIIASFFIKMYNYIMAFHINKYSFDGKENKMDAITYKGYRIMITRTGDVYEAVGYKNEEKEYSHSDVSEEEAIKIIKDKIDKDELSEVIHD